MKAHHRPAPMRKIQGLFGSRGQAAGKKELYRQERKRQGSSMMW